MAMLFCRIIGKFVFRFFWMNCINLGIRARIQKGGVEMDQNKNNKVKDFFRKEGFYLVLFVCLCVVATVAAFTIRKNYTAKEESKANNEFTLNVEDNTSEVDSNLSKQNAERVENDDEIALETENNNEEQEVAEQSEETALNETADATVDESEMVSNTNTNVQFSFPMEGEVAVSREFGKMVRTYADETRTEDVSRRGIDVNAAVGTEVLAVAEGKVEEVSSNTTDGTYVVISHANGLKTVYTNLGEDVNVAVGDIVVDGDVIGTVGNTSGIFTSKVCGDVLNVQVQDVNGKDVDPSAYFNFK